MINIIVATGHNGIIGLGNDLPWPRIPADMKMFAEMTKDSIVIMGRKTWDSIPAKFRPLPNRINVVVTRQDSFVADEGVVVVRKFDQETIDYVKSLHPGKDIFIIGGSEIYRTAIDQNLAEGAYITHVAGWAGMEEALASPDAVFFPADKVDEKFNPVWAAVLTDDPCTCVVERYRRKDLSPEVDEFDLIEEFNNRVCTDVRLRTYCMDTLLGAIPYTSRIRESSRGFVATQMTGDEKWIDARKHPCPFETIEGLRDRDLSSYITDAIVCNDPELDDAPRIRTPVRYWRDPVTNEFRWTALFGASNRAVKVEYYLESQGTRKPVKTKAMHYLAATQVGALISKDNLGLPPGSMVRIAIASVEVFHDCAVINYIPEVQVGMQVDTLEKILTSLAHVYPDIPVLGQIVKGLHDNAKAVIEPFSAILHHYTS